MEDLEYAATCRFCGTEYRRNGIARHVGACPARRAQTAVGMTALFHHLSIADSYLPEYWLHVLAAPDITLRELDTFLREIWVECCNHGSLFEFAGKQIVSMGNVRLDQLPESRHITYAYDFGSATVLRIRQLKPVQHPVDSERIVIAARNDPPVIECAGGGTATIFARDLLDDPDEDAFFCEKCLERYEGDPEMLLPLTNSPRMGVCGYDGPGSDIQGEYASFEGANRQIREFAGTADSVRIKLAHGRELDDLLRKYIDDLRTMPVGARNFRAARLIQRNIRAFAHPLRDMIRNVLGEYGNNGTVPTDYAHLFAIYLLTQEEAGTLFSDLAPYFSRYDVIQTLWGDAFDLSHSWDSLWASLSRNDPVLLLTFALEETTEPFLRANAVNSLVSLYLEDYLEREKLIDYLHLLVEKAVDKQDRLFGRILAMVCCTVYPDDLIRDLQKLHRSDLLDPSAFDYPEDIRRVLQRNTRNGHLQQARETRAFTLMEDPLKELRELFEESLQESMQECTHETTREIPPAPTIKTIPAAGSDIDLAVPGTIAPSDLDVQAVPGPATDTGTVRRSGPKTGRNEPCPCGSGRKYKHCCGRG